MRLSILSRRLLYGGSIPLLAILQSLALHAETGADAWLRYQPVSSRATRGCPPR